MRRRKPVDLEPCIWHGPYFHRKAERIHELTVKAFNDFDEQSKAQGIRAFAKSHFRRRKVAE